MTSKAQSHFKPVAMHPRANQDIWVFVDDIQPKFNDTEEGCFIEFLSDQITSRRFKVSAIDEIGGDQNQSFIECLNGKKYHFNLSVDELTERVIRRGKATLEIHLEDNMFWSEILDQKNIHVSQVAAHLKYFIDLKEKIQLETAYKYKETVRNRKSHFKNLDRLYTYGSNDSDTAHYWYSDSSDYSFDTTVDIDEVNALLKCAKTFNVETVDYTARSGYLIEYYMTHKKMPEPKSYAALALDQAPEIKEEKPVNVISSLQKSQLEALYKKKQREKNKRELSRLRMQR